MSSLVPDVCNWSLNIQTTSISPWVVTAVWNKILEQGQHKCIWAQFLNTTQYCCSQCLSFTNNTQHVQVMRFTQYICSRVLPKEISHSPSEERIWCVWELGSSNLTSFWSLESVHKEIQTLYQPKREIHKLFFLHWWEISS